MDSDPINKTLLHIYQRLIANYGPQHWWPAKSPFEVIVGAILTQSAAWSNVEKAINNLKEAEALSPRALRELSPAELGKLIRPCGYYNAKSLKLKSFARWLGNNYDDSLDKLFVQDTGQLRQQLLAVNGIGQETADSILLYAAAKPTFVIDAYTRRIIGRIGISPDSDSYQAYQRFFMNNLPSEVKLFNEYHALLVCLAKDACRSQPRCHHCCLKEVCQFSIELDADSKTS